MGMTLLFLQVNQVLAQNTVEQVEEAIKDTASEQVTAQTFPVDVTMMTTIAGTIGGLLWKDRKDKKEIEGQLREAVDVLMVLNASYIKFFNASMIYGDKMPKQILQLKSANNALEDSTLAAEMANGIARYQKYALGNFHLQAPNMTTPSPQVINATTVIADNKVNVPPASKTQTNTTVSNETPQPATGQTEVANTDTG